MCGILGFNWKDEKLAKELADLIKHRGPDGEGYYFDTNVSMGHRRLSIIDLSEKGKQPMCNEDETIWITYNGEIFNFKEIRDQLIKLGHIFKSATDTEIIIHGYEEWGIKILDKLNGQFAFCIYDKNINEFFLARDRIGINPLYYYFNNEKFIFGSELKVILQSGIKKEIDEFALNHYLMFGYTPRKQSIIKNAFKLEPGHYIIFDTINNKIKKYEKYWNLRFSNEITDEKIAKKLILEQFEKSVKDRMLADVPVGAFLSGGVDSSAVVAIMSKYTDNLNTFTIKFDYDEYDESKYAEIISKKFKTNHHVITFTAKDVKNLIPKLVFHYDEPFGDHSMIPTYLVSKVAKQHVTVSLSGDGADELFGGYTKYKHYKFIYNFRYFNYLLKLASYILTKPIKLYRFLSYYKLNDFQKFANLSSYFYVDELNKENLKVYSEYLMFFNQDNWLSNVINSDLNLYLSNDILTKVDKASLGNGLESRPPFLDHNLIELVAKINHKLKIKNGHTKYILKKSLIPILPKNIIFRKKKGFGSPIKYYLKKDLKYLISEKVLNFNQHNFFNNLDLDNKFREYESGKKDYSRLFWTLLMFNLWWEKWMT